MADYPDVRSGLQTPNTRPTSNPNLNDPYEPTRGVAPHRSTAGPAIAAAAVVIVVGVVAWNVLGDRDAPVPPAPVTETTVPATPDTSPGVLPAPTPPEAAPQPAPVPDTTPGIVPEGDPAPDLPPVGDPPAAPQTGTAPGTTTAPSN